MKLCIDALGCKNQAFYADKGKKIPEYCPEHKKKGQINVGGRLCIVLDCTSRACCTDPIDEIEFKEGEKIIFKYCAKHKKANSYNSRGGKKVVALTRPEYGESSTSVTIAEKDNKKCIIPGCKKVPIYGAKNSNDPQNCREHMQSDQFEANKVLCIEVGCTTKASYPDEKNEIKHCFKHRINGTKKKIIRNDAEMEQELAQVAKKEIDEEIIINPTIIDENKKCNFQGCHKKGIYGIKNSNIPERCKDHKIAGQAEIGRSICIEGNCTIRSGFGGDLSKATNDDEIKELKKLRHCFTHKVANAYNPNKQKLKSDENEEDMSEIISDVKCENINCKTPAYYGLKDTKIALTCSRHRKSNYVNVISRICIIENCNIKGIPLKIDGKINIYCPNHDPLHNTKKCTEKGCLNLSFYGKINTKNAEFCEKHKKKDQINVIKGVCVVPTCYLLASIADENGRLRQFCSNHNPNKVKLETTQCNFKNCQKLAYHGIEGTKVALTCNKHKKAEYVNVITGICTEKDCLIRSSYADEGSILSKYCCTHKPEKYTILHCETCNFEGCRKRAYCGDKDIGIATHCSEHAEAHFINVINKKCKFPNCTIQCSYGDKETNIPEYCLTHKLEGHVHVKERHCSEPGCTIQALYGFEGDIPVYCKKHCKENQINLYAKKCLNCAKFANFAAPESIVPIYCNEHKLYGHINIHAKICEYENCDMCASFGVKGTKNGIFCETHAYPEHVNVRKKKCLINYCDICASYGIPGTKKPIYCQGHALEGYVNVCIQICIIEGCEIMGCYGIPGTSKGTHCAEHRLPNQVNVKKKNCCHKDCTKTAKYNYLGYTIEYCTEHKEIGMIKNPVKFCCITKCKKKAKYILDEGFYCDFHNPPESSDIRNICGICSITAIGIDEYICDPCELTIKDGKTIKYRFKELVVKKHLDDNNIEIESYDKVISGNCSKKRPDFVIEIDNIQHIMILEVDENQHKRNNYTEQCEITRMKQIYNDFTIEESKLLFIRYNPDNYKPSYGSVFSTVNRLDLLLKYIKNYNFDIDQPGIHVIYLFYDGFDNTKLVKHYIDPCKA